MDPIAELAQQDLIYEIYHPDGHGHLQVEQVSFDWGKSPTELLNKIEQESLWPAFFTMVKTKPEQWLFDLLYFFPKDKQYSTLCFVEFLHMISSRDGLICLLQDSPDWYWNTQTSTLINRVLAITKELIETIPEDPITAEIESSMLANIVKGLKDKAH
jgi:hypothetical protein